MTIQMKESQRTPTEFKQNRIRANSKVRENERILQIMEENFRFDTEENPFDSQLKPYRPEENAIRSRFSKSKKVPMRNPILGKASSQKSVRKKAFGRQKL